MVRKDLAGGRGPLLRQGGHDDGRPQGPEQGVRRQDRRHRARRRRDGPAQGQGAAGLRPGQGLPAGQQLHLGHARRTRPRLRRQEAGRRRAVVAALGLQHLPPDQAVRPEVPVGSRRLHPRPRQQGLRRPASRGQLVDAGLPHDGAAARLPGGRHPGGGPGQHRPGRPAVGRRPPGGARHHGPGGRRRLKKKRTA
ncbi:hypothetical protein SBRY_80176 [Actinacidiphila bryophytorum]|uniref:Uncharacterized protein n=1 Tax=Actinacidiphila bryophytorum TaxID=1436133 RepID=A0A9W4H758_9ACTN|nr:hypothetical protein SBRY_80176 [Actinacidiphila bryophytorum]